MRSLDYYHPWYQTAPALHISIGLTLAGVMVFRVVWRALNPLPCHIGNSKIGHRLAGIAHLALYVLLIVLMTTGYLYATADGRATDMFGLLKIPAIPGVKSLKGTIGWVHKYFAYSLIGLVSIHALAALKHHFFDRDDTLRRMIVGGEAETAAKSEPGYQITEKNI